MAMGTNMSYDNAYYYLKPDNTVISIVIILLFQASHLTTTALCGQAPSYLWCFCASPGKLNLTRAHRSTSPSKLHLFVRHAHIYIFCHSSTNIPILITTLINPPRLHISKSLSVSIFINRPRLLEVWQASITHLPKPRLLEVETHFV